MSRVNIVREGSPNYAGVLRSSAVLLLLFIAGWAPRVLALDAFVTIDERKWLDRSANFYYALSQRGFAATFQHGHPGVTVMWAGTAGFLQEFPEYARAAPRLLTDQELEAWLAANTSHTPVELLVAGRWWIVLAIALTMAGIYLPLRTLLGAWTAAYATLFLAWDPFYIALSRQLHPDGLLAGLTMLALVTFLAWLYGNRQIGYLITSGVAMGLAVLTKSPAFFLLPVLFLLYVWESIRSFKTTDRELHHLQDMAVWCALAAITFIAFWPAAWLDPVGMLSRILALAFGHAVSGHVLPNYFLGQPTDDPGPLFYPVSYLFRTTPATLLGLIAVTIWAVRRQFPLDNLARRRTALALVLFALLFALGMTLGQKKFDRYILPVHLALNIVAALGWVGCVHLLRSHWPKQRARSTTTNNDETLPYLLPAQTYPILLAGLIALHAVPGFVHFPYYLTYYNPVAGGSRTAPNVMLIGWGEGLNEAAAWLNQQPNASEMRVVSWYGDGPLSYYLESNKSILQYYESDHFWFDADYAVLYVNQWQRENPAAYIIDYFLNQTPAYVVEANNLVLARIYDMRNVSPPEFTHIYLKDRAVFGEKIQVPAYRLDHPSVFPGETVEITVFLKSMQRIETDYDAILTLSAPDGITIWQERRPPAGMSTTDWPLHSIWNDTYQILVPADAEPGLYTITLEFPGLAAPSVASADVEDPKLSKRVAPYAITEIQVQSPAILTPNASWDGLQVTTLRHQPVLAPGYTLVVDLSAQGRVDGSLKLSLRLIGSSNDTVAQIDKVLEPDLRFELSVPEDAEPGAYSLVAVVYDADTLASLPDLNGNHSTMLSEVEVTMN